MDAPFTSWLLIFGTSFRLEPGTPTRFGVCSWVTMPLLVALGLGCNLSLLLGFDLVVVFYVHKLVPKLSVLLNEKHVMHVLKSNL
jgi:hypothetical protein